MALFGGSSDSRSLKTLVEYATVTDLRLVVLFYKGEWQVKYDKAGVKTGQPERPLDGSAGTGPDIERACQAYIRRIRGRELQVGAPPTVTTISVPGTL